MEDFMDSLGRSRHIYYILDTEHKAIPCDLEQWSNWFETDRRVAQSRVGNVLISTVFLGIDHRWTGDGKPLLFETLIFNGLRDGYLRRCSTWEEAEHQHQDALKLVSQDQKMEDI
jgi:hypothetical protein